MDLKKRVKSFPTKPGIYIFKDKGKNVIYVGKAKNIRARVKSYFSRQDERPQVVFLLKRAAEIDYIVTDTEKEALLLENTLIKKHRPRYNIFLRDDKTYPSIRIGMSDEFPGISITRRVLKDEAQYFGPFSSSSSCRELCEQAIVCCRIRSCTNTVFANRMRPCLEYDLKRCTAPCVGKVSKENYAGQIQEAIKLLKGNRRDILNKLKSQMKQASEDQDYETAARLRDLASKLEEATEKQKVVGMKALDADYIGIVLHDYLMAFVILEVRAGLLIGKKEYLQKESKEEPQDALKTFIMQHHLENDAIPTIYSSITPSSKRTIEDILSEWGNLRVKIMTPGKGKHRELVQLSIKNAEELIERELKRDKGYDNLAISLAKKLKIPQIPKLIDCLDISNLQGKDAYGSLISFENGMPNKSRYRLYKIRSIFEPNDYAMIKEVLERRFLEGKGLLTDPDLLLVDGGKGQLNIVSEVLTSIDLKIPIAAIAKGGDRPDEIYLTNRKNPLKFKRGAPILLFLMKLRDEAHRFGIKAHRISRKKSMNS